MEDTIEKIISEDDDTLSKITEDKHNEEVIEKITDLPKEKLICGREECVKCGMC